ncbi:hypothetical protein HMPREF9141_2198 [Prevotella multiformis DSM 16608]|uniref:Uncharacterized protein n=1 Tax=Prevotella multiformis DSM 16608 TaxID=888743 RepID=F0F9D1_9BACT|nr:hypothetical protein HMPREF9141_2198 [Prevotella multiformis DSM 16608]
MQGMTVRKQRVLQRRTDCKIKCRKDGQIQCLSISLSFLLPQTTYSHITGVCKHFYAAQS